MVAKSRNESGSRSIKILLTISFLCLANAATPKVLGQYPLPPTPVAQTKESARKLYNNALEHPADLSVLRALEKTLPRSGDYFVLEGDLLKTESELQEYFSAMTQRTAHDGNRELLVALKPNGDLDYYDTPEKRKLTYSIDRRSFPTTQEYDFVASSMQSASAAWVNICPQCGITLTYDRLQDEHPSITTSDFVVRYFDVHGAYIAASFFPHDAPLRRFLNIDPSYFSSTGFDKTGVLRHELGHILGYRHEHIQGIRGCNLEDNAWRPLTPYDPHSVMHYFCGGGGSLALTITDIDIIGHRKLYGPPTTTELTSPSLDQKATPQGTLVVRFEGGDVSQEAAKILDILRNNGVLPTGSTRLLKGQSISEVYTSRLSLPGSDIQLNSLAKQLNPAINWTKPIQTDTTVIYPNVVFSSYRTYLSFDPSSPEDLARYKAAKQNWRYLDPKVEKVGDRERLAHTGYELRLDMPVPIADQLSSVINGLHSKNILAATKDPSRVAHYFSRDASGTLQNIIAGQQSTPSQAQNRLGDLIRLPTSPPCESNSAKGAPRLILLDQPVFHHPQLEGRVDTLTGDIIAAPADTEIVAFHVGSFRPLLDHGTHLAGIMVAKNVGAGPVGVNAAANLTSWNWNLYQQDPTTLGDKLSEQADEITPIFVFASKWSENDEKMIAKPMQAIHALWVTAAGEVKAASRPLNIGANSTEYPMALGNLPYVLVVTECVDCYGDSSRLQSEVNFSDIKNGYVHLAAPGEGIVSTIGNGEYAAASGTSQATAVVAGVVSAMASCWPSYYAGGPEKIKFWIQLSAWPGLRHSSSDPEIDDVDKVSAGIVDGRAALLDPQASWRLSFNQGNLEGSYKTFTPLSWCQNSIFLKGDDGQPTETIDLSRVRRIVRVGDQWFVYARELKQGNDLRLDAVHRIGPGVRTASDNSIPLLHTSDGDMTLADIHDVILHQRIQTGKCQ